MSFFFSINNPPQIQNRVFTCPDKIQSSCPIVAEVQIIPEISAYFCLKSQNICSVTFDMLYKAGESYYMHGSNV